MNTTQYTYNTLSHYFYKVLPYKGYLNESTLKKLVLLTILDRLYSTDYRGCLSKQDIGTLEKLYTVMFGTSCLLPYPASCLPPIDTIPEAISSSTTIPSMSCNNNINSVGSLTEYAHRIQMLESLIQDLQDNGLGVQLPPLELRVIDRTHSALTIAWVGTAPNYTVLIKNSETQIEESYVTNQTTITITDLKPYTYYTIKVRSMYKDSYQESQTLNARTLKDPEAMDRVFYLFSDKEAISDIFNMYEIATTDDAIMIVNNDYNTPAYLYLVCSKPYTLTMYDTIGELVGWDKNAEASNIPGYNIYRSDNKVNKFNFKSIEINK